MTFEQIFSKTYLFDPTPTTKSRLYIPFLILFCAMILFSIVISLQKQNKKILKKFFYPFLVTGILGLIYLFARYESLPYLASRFTILLIIAVFFIWFMVNLIWMLRFIPKHSRVQKSEERFRKYLPKSKRVSK